ncbi:MAG TPA: HAMP domain-containing sensor histidine kinase [Xanthomonadaceae bacterium]|nr:HAMP domain-containing sensor histidine kinase [Xanthomonadaceae bacterium]
MSRLTPPGRDEAEQRRELYFFSLYRVFEAALLTLVLLTPPGTLVAEPRHPLLGLGAALAYLVMSGVLLYWASRRRALKAQVKLGAGIDIVAATLAIHALPSSAPGIALMLLFNIGSAALLLPLRYGLGGAAMAAAAMIGEYVWSYLRDDDVSRPLAERVMFAVSYLSIAMLTYLLGRQMREAQALVVQRGAELADLAEVNELIIRRMRTGVLLVDDEGRIRLANEAAQALLGPHDGERILALAAPELARRLQQWRADGNGSDLPLKLGDGSEVLPRFARLRASGDSALVFLDDTALVSRRAESMTLATLGRFSASLAHEIRNPLAAISYATQLLEESEEMSQGDRRLLQIIHQQCLRTNGIVESVLGIARRERASAEHVDLVAFARRFVQDYQQTLQPENGSLQLTAPPGAVAAMVDPRHLQQILTVLVQNALTYGRLPHQPARVSLAVHRREGRPTLEVLDRGPGIPEANASQLFRPFFTTSEHGTGLGLYIASELARANDASLAHVPVPGGGSCFRLLLAGTHALAPA